MYAMRVAYQKVEWALDIREPKFRDADFYYVPGELIRRETRKRSSCCIERASLG